MSIGVKIENLSSQTINLTPSSFHVRSETVSKDILSPETYAKKIRQHVGLHLLHALWGPWSFSYQENPTTGETTTNFIYIPIGLIVGIGNAVHASNANKANLAAHKRSTIWSRPINPGETVYSLMPIQILNNEKIQFSYRQDLQRLEVAVPFKINGPYAPPIKDMKSRPYSFFVLLKDNTSFTANTKIDIDGKVHTITAMINGLPTLIKPAATRSLSRHTSEGRQLLGIAADSCWLFQVIKGRINAYYFLSEQSAINISHIQKGTGPIVPFSPDNLKAMTEFDAEVDELIFRQKYVKAITIFNAKY
jgi:hypothetical protein